MVGMQSRPSCRRLPFLRPFLPFLRVNRRRRRSDDVPTHRPQGAEKSAQSGVLPQVQRRRELWVGKSGVAASGVAT